MEFLYLLVSFTNQFISLIDGEYSGVDSLAHVNVGISQQCYELFTFVLHASKRNGDLIVVELLWEDDQQSGLNHAGQQLTLLWCRTAISVINMLQNKLEIDPLPFSPSEGRPTHRSPWKPQSAAGLIWNWDGIVKVVLETRQAGVPGKSYSTVGHIYNCTAHLTAWEDTKTVSLTYGSEKQKKLKEFTPHTLCSH